MRGWTKQGGLRPERISAADLLAVLLMGAWIFWIDRKIRISGLYMDDLYLWSCYGEQSFTEFVFPVGSKRFRPVFWALSWLELRCLGTHLGAIVPFNLVLLLLTGAVCYRFMTRLSGSRIAAWALSTAFVTSRFSYYDVSQLLGMMEAAALLMAVGTGILLFRYLHSGSSGAYYGAVLLYLLACYTHERYMVLLPMFYYVLLVRKDRGAGKPAAPAAAFLLVVLSRYAITGRLLPAGTGGTEVTETFTLKSFIKSGLSEIAYLFGINAGPEHLNGLPWSQTPLKIRLVVFLLILSAAALTALFLRELLKRTERGSAVRNETLADTVLFLGFIAGCMAASSVTIRVEMRWIYVSLAFALFLLAYLWGWLRDYVPRLRTLTAALLGVCVLCLLTSDLYYRQFWGRIYLFPNQARYNSLADETYGRFGEEIFGKTIYIIGNSYEMSEFTGETFFKTFDPERRAEGTSVVHVEDAGQVPEAEDCVVLREVPERDAFELLRGPGGRP